MTQWMLVSHEWLRIVLTVVLRDVWITSIPHMHYMSKIVDASYICQLAGIVDVGQYLVDNCRSLTVSVFQKRQEEYAAQCAELEEYARNPNRTLLIEDLFPFRRRQATFAIPPKFVATFIRDYVPCITSLHFVLVDCTPVYYNWEMRVVTPYLRSNEYPWNLTDLYITFAYTTPPPALLRDAPRGTFYPPRSQSDIPPLHKFDGVRRLVVRDVHADFIAFITTACPKLECIESTAEFRAEDLPPKISDERRERFVFRRLAPAASWGLPVPTPRHPPPTVAPTPDAAPVLIPASSAEASPPLSVVEPTPAAPLPPTGDFHRGRPKQKHSLWGIVRRAFRKRS